MSVTVDVEIRELTPERPFQIARGTTATQPVLVVRLEDEAGRVGRGCASPSSYYGETIDTVQDVLPELAACVRDLETSLAGASLHERLQDERGGTDPAARAGIEIAAHDLAAKRLELPLYQWLGWGGEHDLRTSYTIGIDDPEAMAEHAAEAVAAGFDVLKVKLGTEADRSIVRAVRRAVPEARIRVDANGGWKASEAVEMADFLDEHGVEFLEQPVAAEDQAGFARVAERSPLPVAADESCQQASDVPAVGAHADIVTVKLMKTGGIRGAIEQIHAATAHGCEIMLGCMLESSLSIAAAAHLLPYASYADLDGALLVADDPYETACIAGNRVAIGPRSAPGTGATPRT